jgi:uncharacterized membrane protein (UPF0127 family)
MAWNKHKTLYLLSAILILAIIFLFYSHKTAGVEKIAEYKNIEIKGNHIYAETVSDPGRQYLGLSNRESLCANCGMLFAFPDKQIREFVMRDMKFPLDIIFINDNKIINIAENLPPEGAKPLNIYASSKIANNVLEIPAGFCQKNGIKAGDIIRINN